MSGFFNYLSSFINGRSSSKDVDSTKEEFTPESIADPDSSNSSMDQDESVPEEPLPAEAPAFNLTPKEEIFMDQVIIKEQNDLLNEIEFDPNLFDIQRIQKFERASPILQGRLEIKCEAFSEDLPPALDNKPDNNGNNSDDEPLLPKSEKKKTFPCHQCKQIFSVRFALFGHLKKHIVKCIHCHKKLRNNKILQYHKIAKHFPVMRCEIENCPSRTPYKGTYMKHLQVKHDPLDENVQKLLEKLTHLKADYKKLGYVKKS